MIYICIIIVVIILISSWNKRKLVTARNGKKWWVLRGPGEERAAELMSEINERMVKLMRALQSKYGTRETIENINETDEIMFNCAQSLLNNYNPENFYETRAGYNTSTYTVNKGESMYICLRDGDFVNINTLMFVILHECAHIANYKSWGHDTRFWDTFAWLLNEAIIADVYKYVDYKKNPVKYCGIIINHQPLLS